MNVFVLHAMGDFGRARKTSVDHVMCFPRYQPQHNYYFHDINAAVPECVQNFPFDGVILDTTALCIRYYRPRDLFYAEKQRYGFIAEWDAVKVAFPQDDYDHSAILDQWLVDYEVDAVYSVLWPHREIIYPGMMQKAVILESLTGYVNDTDVREGPIEESWHGGRSIDLGYRAKFLPAQFGSYGQIKGRIAQRVASGLDGRGFAIDISTDPAKVLLGDAWPRFLGDCRFCLGSEGGSSILDPDGQVTDRVRWYSETHPDASFAEIAAACLGDEDGRYVFSAISPRLFEAALAGCGQVLVRAPFLGALVPGEHYLPVDEEPTDLSELAEALRDEPRRRTMVEACYQALIATDRYRYSTHARRVMSDMVERRDAKGLRSASDSAFERMRTRARCVGPSVLPTRVLRPMMGGLSRLLDWVRSG